MDDNFKLNFQDTETAFADKSDAELKSKYQMFKMMNSPFLTEIGTKTTEFALRLGLPVKGLIKSTIYTQFCGGETIEECQSTIERLGASGVGTILDYSAEGKSDEKIFESTKNEIYRTITRAKEDPFIPFAVFKMTGVARFEILEKVSAERELLKGEAAEWDRAKARVYELCQYAHSLDQPLLIDAEETWIQNALDALVTEMMEKFNGEKPIIYNTVQLYRTDRLEFLRQSHEQARRSGYFYGVKLVRGAYLEKERERAEEMGYPSPVHDDKESTDRDYDAAVDYCLENIADVAFVAGTHNEESTCRLAEAMHRRGIPHDHPNVWFSQLYGMSDNLTYVLAKNGYNVCKYVPYGPVEEAVPYLIRRAEENTAVAGQMSRELDLVNAELKRRGLT